MEEGKCRKGMNCIYSEKFALGFWAQEPRACGGQGCGGRGCSDEGREALDLLGTLAVDCCE